MESNAKIVKWSDGSYQMVIGKEFLDISKDRVTNSFLFEHASERLSLMKFPIESKVHVNPSLDSHK